MSQDSQHPRAQWCDMTGIEIRDQVEGLVHDARVRRLVELGTASLTDPSITAAIDELEAGSRYERALALWTCYGSQDGKRVLRRCVDESATIRKLAVSLVPLACDDAQALSALDVVPPRLHLHLIQRLRRANRQEPIDCHLLRLRERGDRRVESVMAYGSPDVVGQLAGALGDHPARAAWKRLARMHPLFTADRLARDIDDGEGSGEWLADVADVVIPLVAEHHPDRALTLVNALHHIIPLARINLMRLSERLPREVTDLVLASNEVAATALSNRTRMLDGERIVQLMRRYPIAVGPNYWQWLGRLPAHDRELVFLAIDQSPELPNVLWFSILAKLPRQARARAVERALAGQGPIAKVISENELAPLFGFDQATARLSGDFHHPDVSIRDAAYTALINVAKIEPEHLNEILLMLEGGQFDQGGVKASMLRALRSLPPAVWSHRHLPRVGELIRWTLDSADFSHHEFSVIVEVLTRLAVVDSDWTRTWLTTLFRERSTFFSVRYNKPQPRTLRRILAEALDPLAADWEARDQVELMLSLSSLLGDELQAAPTLVASLLRLIEHRRVHSQVDQSIRTLMRQLPSALSDLLPRLLADNPARYRIWAIASWMNHRRQDLLTPFLSAPFLDGPFGEPKSRYPMPFTTGFAHWTANQQTIYAAMISEMTGSPAGDQPAAMFAIERFPHLAWTTPDRLITLAETDHDGEAVRIAALIRLGRLDGAEGLPALIDALGDERARHAIYAIGRLIRSIPPQNALLLLLGIQSDKVTVTKQVVRFIGELPIEEAFQCLLVLDAQELHRDVRVALIRSLDRWLDRDEAWRILERSVASPALTIAEAPLDLPVAGLSKRAEERLVSLLVTALSRDDSALQRHVLRRLSSDPLPDRTERFAPLLGPLLTQSDKWDRNLAVNALMSTYGGRNDALIANMLASVIPNRSVLKEVVETLCRFSRTLGASRLDVARQFISALAADPVVVDQRCRLAIEWLPSLEIADLFESLSQRDLLTPIALARSIDALTGLTFGRYRDIFLMIPQSHSRQVRRWRHPLRFQNYARAQYGDTAQELARFPAVDRMKLVDAFRAVPDERLRAIAAAALIGIGAGHGWTPERREHLDRFKTDPSPMVAALAQFTFPDEFAV